MAKFYDTSGITHRLVELIKNAEDKLIIISPYLKINDRIKELLKDRNMFKVNISIIYGKRELHPDESNWLNSLEYVKTSFCKNLHAKCYLNEKEAIITSMNLYEFSQVNNTEMGIHVSKDEDSELYADIDKEVKRLLRLSSEVKASVEEVPKKEIHSSFKSRFSKSEKGFCIRCKTPIRLNPKAPYCPTHYKSWKRYEDPKYEEKNGVCHICGKPNKSSLKKPTCPSCYKKNKNLFK